MSDAVLIALIVTIGTVINAAIGGLVLVKGRETHRMVNSRMTELVEATRAAASAEGKAEGRLEGHEAPEP